MLFRLFAARLVRFSNRCFLFFLCVCDRIKKGEAEIGVKPSALAADDGQPEHGSGLVLAPRLAGHDEDADGGGESEQTSTQSVLAFTMKDWKRLCAENFAEGEEGGLPHRTGSKIPKHEHSESQQS